MIPLVIDFQKEKVKHEKKKPQGYFGYFKRQLQKEQTREAITKYNEILSDEKREGLIINKECRMNMPKFWGLIVFLEVIFFIVLIAPNQTTGGKIALAITMILMFFAPLAIQLFLHFERKNLQKNEFITQKELNKILKENYQK